MNGRGKAIEFLQTAPYPHFPTDLQAQVMAVLATADGTSKMEEAIFENRYMHVPELNRLGAKISLKEKMATIDGVEHLRAAPVMATDLRASMSLVIAGMKATGETIINRIYHLDRGYDGLEKKTIDPRRNHCPQTIKKYTMAKNPTKEKFGNGRFASPWGRVVVNYVFRFCIATLLMVVIAYFVMAGLFQTMLKAELQKNPEIIVEALRALQTKSQSTKPVAEPYTAQTSNMVQSPTIENIYKKIIADKRHGFFGQPQRR